MANHPNRHRISDADIRSHLVERYGVEADCVKTGAEADEDEAGLYYGEADSWIVYGTMPNTNQDGWFFAGYSGDLARDIRAERSNQST